MTNSAYTTAKSIFISIKSFEGDSVMRYMDVMRDLSTMYKKLHTIRRIQLEHGIGSAKPNDMQFA